MSNLINALAPAFGQDVFLRTEPEILDFTNPEVVVNLIIITKDFQITVKIPKGYDLKDTLGELLGFLGKARIIMAWNIKNFLSYVLYYSKQNFPIIRPFFDLKVLESYLGIRQECPKTFNEAKGRLGQIVKNPLWNYLKIIYESIHIPLIKEVLPKIENLGLVNTNLKTILHPCYEIEGQINGRMKCSENFKHCFNPHSLSDEDKSHLATPDYDNKNFVYLDFKYMEVSVLQWLSKDKILGDILQTGRDLYELIWEIVTGIDCNAELREKCKSFFLPLIFGEGVKTLSKSIGISENTSWKLFKRTTDKFETAFNWVKEQKLENGMCMDRLHRLRKFEDDYQPKLRNFAIQSPASTICLHKLVKLHKAINNLGKICFHLHDGYCIMSYKDCEDKLYKVAKEALESPEELYPGLILRASVYKGRKLNELKLMGEK
jgi:hypothetical protein